MKENNAKKNTDTELWREPADKDGEDFYMPSVHVTETNRLGINVGGHTFQLPLREWHQLAVDKYGKARPE